MYRKSGSSGTLQKFKMRNKFTMNYKIEEKLLQSALFSIITCVCLHLPPRMQEVLDSSIKTFST